MVVIIMGVSGCGKTTVGKLLAINLGLPFYDADDFHPPKNVKKMSSGKPLNDANRQPWLEILAEKIEIWNSKKGAILACSALKESYREVLISKSDDVQFVFLKGDRDTILNRMRARKDHYMPPELLDSQFITLEEPDSAIIVTIDKSPTMIASEIVNHPKLLHVN